MEKQHRRSYRIEILINIAAGAVVSFAGLTVSVVIESKELRLLVGLFATTIILLGISLFRQKYLIDSRYEKLDKLLHQRFGFFSINDQFFARSEHWADEKRFLARALVEELLPNLLDQIERSGLPGRRICLLLDSGTTLAPVFSHLMGSEILLKRDLHVYTNNLAGIEEIQRLEFVDGRTPKEQRFHLVPGQPLRKYRATLGEETLNYLKDISAPTEKPPLWIAVVTANWILAGQSLANLAICARDSKHLDFKEAVIGMADYVILLTPLGKILRLEASDISTLNNWLPESKDSSYGPPLVISAEKKETTYLLTSFRDEYSESPLVQTSNRLHEICDKDEGKNFKVHPLCSTFPTKDLKNNLIYEEIPHDYVRKHAREAHYGVPMFPFKK